MRAVVWILALTCLVGTCVVFQEYGWTGLAWLAGAFLVDRHFAHQAAIRRELEEANARARANQYPPRYW